MENKEIKIKSYEVLLQNLLILMTIMVTLFFLIGLAVCGWDNNFWVFYMILFILIFLFLLGAILTRIACRTYDIYSEEGIKRIRGKKVIFEVKWDNLQNPEYFGFIGVMFLSPYTLTFSIKAMDNLSEHYNYNGNREVLITPMRKKTLKLIKEIVPIEIKY